jgi:hypothetical protein
MVSCHARGWLGVAICGFAIQCGGNVSPTTDDATTSGRSSDAGAADSDDSDAGTGGESARQPNGGTAQGAPLAVGSGRSCKALLRRAPGVQSGFYFVSAGSGEEHFTYCDMATAGGGWTRVTYPQDSDTWIASLIGAGARQMLKCTNDGRDHIISPAVAAWSWSSQGFRLIPGKWVVNGRPVGCGANRSRALRSCTSMPYGVGCSDGPPTANNVVPGLNALEDEGDACAMHGTVYTSGAFSICGEVGSAAWVAFLREED